MLASVTEVEVELHVPEDASTFFGVTWAQGPRKDKVFIKAFPRETDGRKGLLESTGLVEIGDCLTAINGIPVGTSTLQEIMSSIRSAKSPLSLRFARYPPPELSVPSSPGSLGSLPSHSGSGTSLGFDSSSPRDTRDADGAAGDDDSREGVELENVLNSALVLGLGERVLGIQRRNAKLVRAVSRIGQAAGAKREGVEGVASAAATLTATAGALPRVLRGLAAVRQDVSALCEAMARLDELLAARERAQAARRRTHEEGGLPGGVGNLVGMEPRPSTI